MADKKDNSFGYIASPTIGDLQTRAQNSTTSAIFQNHSSVKPSVETAPDTDAKIELTDLMPNQKFDVPTIKPVSNLDVNKAVKVAPEDPTHLRTEVNKVAEAYMTANQACMDTISDAICDADPQGQSVVNAIFPAAPSSGLATVAASVMDPSGVAGSVYATINEALHKKPANADEILTKALSELHKMSDPVQQAQKTSSTPQKPNPHGFDFTAIKNNTQLENFVRRDPKEDKVMQKVEAAHEGLDVMDGNKNNYKNNYTKNITGEKIIAAMEGGKNPVSELDAGTVLLSKVSEIVAPGAKNMQKLPLSEQTDIIPYGKSQADDLGAEAKRVMASLNMEFDPRLAAAIGNRLPPPQQSM